MHGTRFAFGLAAGVLFGLAIVVSSSLSFGVFGTFSAANVAQNQAGGNLLSSTTTAATSSSTTNGSASALQSLPSTATNSTTSSSTYPTGGFAFAPAYSSPSVSRLGSLAQQPVASTTYALVPALIALLFGLLIYRASRPRPERDSSEENSGKS